MSPEWPVSWDGASTCDLALLGGEEPGAIWTPLQAATHPSAFQSDPFPSFAWAALHPSPSCQI